MSQVNVSSVHEWFEGVGVHNLQVNMMDDLIV